MIARQGIDRRSALALVAGASATIPLFQIMRRRASASGFSFRMATGQHPDHPVNARAREAIGRIEAATGGAFRIALFPANQLGSDTDLLAQVRSGGVDLFVQASSVLATLVPAAGIVNTGFAFADYAAVWRAMDGALGAYVRQQIERAGLVSVSHAWDNGFRQVTSSSRAIRTPRDLAGFRIRVPQAPMLTSLFKALGAGPTPIGFNELYTSLQTRLVEGQENPLPIIATAKLYEVQRFVSMTSHVWDAYWLIGNRPAWDRIPSEFRAIAVREFDRAGLDQRADIARLSDTLRGELAAKGLTVIDADRAAFRAALQQTDFYADWRQRYGGPAWAMLEQSAGALV